MEFLLTGAIFGLSAGLTPGPLLALVISETLAHSRTEGVKVALAPLITDLPIVTTALLVLVRLADFHAVLAAISILGGLFVLYLGYENIRSKRVRVGIEGAEPRSLRRGVIMNVLSPHPYLFWFTVGGPTVVKALEYSTFAAAAFIGAFYLLLVGSKIVLAFLAGWSRAFLAGSVYVYIMRLLGSVLCLFGILLLRDGLELIGLL